MIEVDARGLSCPEPIMMMMAALKEANGETIQVIVSDASQRENVKAQAERKKKNVTVEQKGRDYYLTIS